MQPEGNGGKAAESAVSLLRKAILETTLINRSVNGLCHFTMFLQSMALNVLKGKGYGPASSTIGEKVHV